jgi:hypothetical protein
MEDIAVLNDVIDAHAKLIDSLERCSVLNASLIHSLELRTVRLNAMIDRLNTGIAATNQLFELRGHVDDIASRDVLIAERDAAMADCDRVVAQHATAVTMRDNVVFLRHAASVAKGNTLNAG